MKSTLSHMPVKRSENSHSCCNSINCQCLRAKKSLCKAKEMLIVWPMTKEANWKQTTKFFKTFNKDFFADIELLALGKLITLRYLTNGESISHLWEYHFFIYLSTTGKNNLWGIKKRLFLMFCIISSAPIF